MNMRVMPYWCHFLIRQVLNIYNIPLFWKLPFLPADLPRRSELKTVSACLVFQL